MEVSLVGKPETIATPKSCCICGKETDFMVAHKPDCHADAGCDCNLHVCSSTACEVRGVGRGIFHRTKINPRRNPMEMEVVEEAEVNEEPEVDLVSNPDDDYGACAECGDPLDEDGDCYACDVEPISNPDEDDEYPMHEDVECEVCGDVLRDVYLEIMGPAEKRYQYGPYAPQTQDNNYYIKDLDDYRNEAFGEHICTGCADELRGETRKNPAESKIAKYAKTGGLIGAGAILGWFLKDRLD